MEKICAYILTGGQPDELDPLTEVRNKAALPVLGMYRIIDFALSNLMNSEIDNVGVITQYLPGSLMEHIGIGFPWDFVGYGRSCRVLPPFYGKKSMQWYENGFDGIKKNLFFAKSTGANDVLVLSGDNIYKMDYRPIIDYHRMNDADVTIVVKKFPAIEIENRLGLVSFDNSGRIKYMLEKPAAVDNEGFASIGIYLFKASAFYDILENTDLSGDKRTAGIRLWTKLRDYKAFTYVTDEDWHYVRDLEEYAKLNLSFLNEEKIKKLDLFNIRTSMEDRHTGYRPSSVIKQAKGANNVFIPKGVRIFGEAENCIFSPGAYIERGAIVKDSIIFHDTVVKAGAVVRNAVVDKDVVVSEKAEVGGPGKLTVVGKGRIVNKGERVEAGVKLSPFRGDG